MRDENVEIVKMDATANDVPPQFDVRGFPTIFWLPNVVLLLNKEKCDFQLLTNGFDMSHSGC